MKPYSVIFCGTPEFAVPSLKALVDNHAFSVDLVITQPDKEAGRKKIITPSPIKIFAKKNDIKIYQPTDINNEWDIEHATLKTKPDFLVVVAYGQLLKQHIIELPGIVSVNIHPSLLPRWRGASPIQNAILAGDTETGVTVQRITKKLDSGPILAQISTEISKRETAKTLHDKLARLGAKLLTETLTGNISETPQNEKYAVICGKLSREDGIVNPSSMTANEIDRRVRALIPWPGVQCEISGINVKLLETSLTETQDSIPLTCKNNTILHIVKLQMHGKNAITGKEWQRGMGSFF